MFTGIVQERAPAVSLAPFDGGLRLVLGLSPRRAGLALGASVAVNGTCLTVTGLMSGGRLRHYPRDPAADESREPPGRVRGQR